MDTAGVRCGCADKQIQPGDWPTAPSRCGEPGKEHLGRGRREDGPDTLGYKSRSTSDHRGWESCPDPTRQSPREPPVSPGGGVRTSSPQGTPSRGPERGG